MHEVRSAADITDLISGTLMKMTKTGDDWIKYEFPEPKTANILEIVFRGTGEFYGFYGDRQPNWFKLEASNDDENWDLLLERQYQGNENAHDGNVLIFHLNNETAYKYYRLVCVATNSSAEEWGICGFKLYQRKLGKTNFYSSIPLLSSATQDGYEISASSQYNNEYIPHFAFDGNSITAWASSGIGNQWLKVKLPNLMACNTAKIASRNDISLTTQAPKDFEIQGSLDGETWETLTTEEGITWTTQGQTQTFEFENETAYLYYRLLITACNGASEYCLSEFSLGNSLREYKRFLTEYNYLVPVLSANSDQGYNVSSSSVFQNAGHFPYKVFDGSTGANNKWLSNTNDTTSAWLKVELPSAEVANGFLLQMPNEGYSDRSPKNFKIQASNDDISWTDLVTASNLSWSSDQARSFTCDNNVAYKFYRIFVTATCGGNVLHIGVWRIYYFELIREY